MSDDSVTMEDILNDIRLCTFHPLDGVSPVDPCSRDVCSLDCGSLLSKGSKTIRIDEEDGGAERDRYT